MCFFGSSSQPLILLENSEIAKLAIVLGYGGSGRKDEWDENGGNGDFDQVGLSIGVKFGSLSILAPLCYKPTVSSLNDEIDFKISFDEFDDEDYTVIFDKNSFSHKIISVNDLKTDSENDDDKVNMPLFSSHGPTVSYFDDLDFFKDFENEFPSIVYNDDQTSKSDLLTESILNPQHINEFNLKDETSMSECDEEEQNVLNFNDLFPFNVIYPDELKTNMDNDNDKVDIEHSSGDLSVKPLPDVINTDVGSYTHGSNKLLETNVFTGKSSIGYPNPMDFRDIVKEISTNIDGELKYVEILKCWSLETSSAVRTIATCKWEYILDVYQTHYFFSSLLRHACGASAGLVELVFLSDEDC
ncbi:hypothetical protein Tco_0524535 [Tanacetum coccineum]